VVAENEVGQLPFQTNLTDCAGTYALVLNLGRDDDLTVGRLGRFDLPAGFYVYVGSALGPGGLAARIARHVRHPKLLHWHVDYLRVRACPIAVWFSVGDQRRECTWAATLAQMEGGSIPVPRFGASDCRCVSHLVWFPASPDRKEIAKLVGAQLTEVRLDV
jgi:Uri superfamily endonuclease